ncbi:hypothetical protein SAMN02983006_00880 [Halanaerobium salsuginis]|jgi:hypothetical protein|uniref:DUF374 domain-containing protein n=1 Tax=Halanaerobium salsuginis TaxID=29563 RepID=A0A1I4GVZ8_9FIRM|nr:hypothetical protein SAMN02983006_00880 [Halanaerobium salsuginis]
MLLFIRVNLSKTKLAKEEALLSIKNIFNQDKVLPLLAYNLLRWTNISLRLQVEGWEKVNDDLKAGHSLVFSIWHGKLWLPAYFLRAREIYALASLSQDGSYIADVLERLGWRTVRGSSSRGASRSLLSLYRKLKHGASAAITPDGPTGPIYQVKGGIIFLQEKADALIVPVGADASWKKNFSSWDNFMLPLPFSRAALVFGAPFSCPEAMEMEARQELLQSKMKEVNDRAAQLISQ